MYARRTALASHCFVPSHLQQVGIPTDVQFDISKETFKFTVRVRPEDAPQSPCQFTMPATSSFKTFGRATTVAHSMVGVVSGRVQHHVGTDGPVTTRRLHISHHIALLSCICIMDCLGHICTLDMACTCDTHDIARSALLS